MAFHNSDHDEMRCFVIGFSSNKWICIMSIIDMNFSLGKIPQNSMTKLTKVLRL